MSDLATRVAALERLVARLAQRSSQPVALARSTVAPVDTGPVQTIQGQMDALSRRDAIPVLFSYGFSSNMPAGGDKLIVYPSGDRSKGVVVATGHQTYRLKGLNPGETAIYDQWGQTIKLVQTGPTIDGSGQPTTIKGDLHVTGAVIAGYASGDQVSLQTHRHGTGTPAAGTVAPTPGS